MRNADAGELRRMLVSRRDLLRDGLTERGIRDAVAGGRLTLVRRGWYVDAAFHIDLWPESRHLLHVFAVAADSGGGAVASHVSAAALHRLPFYRFAPARVHVTTPQTSRISSSPDVFRHVGELDAADVVTVEGVRCTSLPRTVFDVSRMLAPEAALSCADAGERAVALQGQELNPEAARRWRHDLLARIERGGGMRGIRQARRVAEFADGRAQLPGESVTRLQLLRLGFPRPQLQSPVPAPGGGLYFVDFALEQSRSFLEFDGVGKYRDEAMRKGLSLEDVLLAEKQREDWIRGTTQWGLARCADAHIGTPKLLAARLASFGIRPPR